MFHIASVPEPLPILFIAFFKQAAVFGLTGNGYGSSRMTMLGTTVEISGFCNGG